MKAQIRKILVAGIVLSILILISGLDFKETSASICQNPYSSGESHPPSRLSDSKSDWPMWGVDLSRNLISDMINPPTDWDTSTGKNVKWIAKLGSLTYGNPVISGGKIFIGTNNEGLRDPDQEGDRGVLLALRESNGEFLWQATSEKLKSGMVNDWPEQGICSTPFVEGDRLYYVTSRCEVVCLDTEGFRDEKTTDPSRTKP